MSEVGAVDKEERPATAISSVLDDKDRDLTASQRGSLQIKTNKQKSFEFAATGEGRFEDFGARGVVDLLPSASPFAASLDWDRASSRNGDQFGWRLYDGSMSAEVGKGEMLRDDFWSRFAGKTIVTERAHMMPRTRKSKAQIYEQHELDVIASLTRKHGVSVVLLPEALGQRVRNETGLDKTQMSVANWIFYSRHREIPLQRWPICVSLPSQKNALPAIKEDMNILLNELRTYDYVHHPLYTVVVDIMERSLSSIYPASSRQPMDEMKKDFQIARKNGKLTFNKTSVMTVAALVFNADGAVRKNPSGEFIGVRTAMRALSLHAFKGSHSGVARSNIMYHFMRGGMKNASEEQWRAARRRRRRSVKTLLKLFRDYVGPDVR